MYSSPQSLVPRMEGKVNASVSVGILSVALKYALLGRWEMNLALLFFRLYKVMVGVCFEPWAWPGTKEESPNQG